MIFFLLAIFPSNLFAEEYCTLINDGSFENGPPPDSAWTEWASSGTGYSRIREPYSGWAIHAYDGAYAFWAGGSCLYPISNYVEQSISIPAGATDLKFKTVFRRTDDDDDPTDDYFYVKINDATVFTRELIQENNTHPDWTEQTVDISAYAGQTVTLRFEAHQAPEPSLVGNVLIDYVRTCITTVVPTVTTTAISSITSNSASSGGNVTSNGGASVTARGVCWSTSVNPTTSDSHTSDETGIGSFTSSITGLSPITTYHVRAYATNSEGTGYGSEETFTTKGKAMSWLQLLLLGD